MDCFLLSKMGKTEHSFEKKAKLSPEKWTANMGWCKCEEKLKQSKLKNYIWENTNMQQDENFLE